MAAPAAARSAVFVILFIACLVVGSLSVVRLFAVLFALTNVREYRGNNGQC